MDKSGGGESDVGDGDEGRGMTAARRATVGAAAWVIWVGWHVPNLHHAAWAHALLALAALVLVPLALGLAESRGESGRVATLVRWTNRVQLPAALLLAIACGLPAGGWAALATVPWVVLTGMVAVTGWLRARQGGWRRPVGKMCGDAALMFLAVGGAWVFADRAGARPLNFDPAIVTLTAVHFHFAGLLLPLLAGLAMERFPESRFAARAAVGTVLGVPAVAAGITATQLGWGPAFESAAGCGLALAGMAVAILHVRLGTERTGTLVTRAWLLVAGGSLFFGMMLAGVYALRALAQPVPWLDVPWMRAVHGTVNALGFGLGGVLAWRGMAAGQGSAPK